MTYPEALEYLYSFVNHEKEDGYDYKKSFRLDRMRRLAAILGDPQKSINSVHIAGTKGKGSTSAIVASILQNAGFRTGLYTSPHLVSVRERIRIDGSLISEDDLARLAGILKSAVGEMKDDIPSFFEVYTALAFMYFKEKKIDFAVYEVGLGGRLDATNIIEALVSAITPISYEHMDKLGTTLRKIASEKAGILKEGGVCIMAPQEKEAESTIEDICNKRNVRLIRIGRDIKFKEISTGDTRQVFDVSGLCGDYLSLETSLLGYHQVVNAATAVGIIEALRFRNVPVKDDSIREGIRCARWEGRLEIIRKDPFVILDGAQNKASANALAQAIKRLFKYKRLILVLGVCKDKDIEGILEELLPISDPVVLTKSNIAERAMEPSKIREHIRRKDKTVVLTASVKEAMEKASAIAMPDDIILATGSLFVVGEIKEAMAGREYVQK